MKIFMFWRQNVTKAFSGMKVVGLCSQVSSDSTPGLRSPTLHRDRVRAPVKNKVLTRWCVCWREGFR